MGTIETRKSDLEPTDRGAHRPYYGYGRTNVRSCDRNGKPVEVEAGRDALLDSAERSVER